MYMNKIHACKVVGITNQHFYLAITVSHLTTPLAAAQIYKT